MNEENYDDLRKKNIAERNAVVSIFFEIRIFNLYSNGWIVYFL